MPCPYAYAHAHAHAHAHARQVCGARPAPAIEIELEPDGPDGWALKKEAVISRDLGKVTSNTAETVGKCLTDLRDKSHVLNAMHYKCKSNLGLMLANQTYMLHCFDRDYHFKLDVMATSIESL